MLLESKGGGQSILCLCTFGSLQTSSWYYKTMQHYPDLTLIDISDWSYEETIVLKTLV